MKTLELKELGVIEMNPTEMKNIDGGFPLLASLIVFAVGALIGYLVTRDVEQNQVQNQ